MPELPEVEVTRLGLLPLLPGQQVLKVGWSNKRLRLPIPRKKLALHIRGAGCVTIDRRGKFLLLRMTNASVLVIHLGMTGKLSVLPSGQPLAKHDHLRLRLANGTELRYNDARRFGSIEVWPPEQAAELEKHLSDTIGAEPFSSALHADYLLRIARARSLPVKSFLMNGKNIAGIGNIYANEILFDVSIHPLTPAGNLDRTEWKKIISSCRTIMKKAILAGGSTISDFLGTGGNPGYFQLHFTVYGRKGEKCTRCSDKIHKTVIAGRATYTCPTCQQTPEKMG